MLSGKKGLVIEIVPRAFRWGLRLSRERELTDANVESVRRRIIELAQRKGRFTDWPRFEDLYEPSLRRRTLMASWYEAPFPEHTSSA